MRKTTFAWVSPLALLAALALAGCGGGGGGGSSSGGGNNGGSPVAQTAPAPFTPAGVTNASTFSVTIPIGTTAPSGQPGTPAVAFIPSPTGAPSGLGVAPLTAFTFGQSGVSFSNPITVNIAIPQAALVNKNATNFGLYMLSNGVYTPVTGSTFSVTNGVTNVAGTTTQGGTFAVVGRALAQPVLRAYAGDVSGANAGNFVYWSAASDPPQGNATPVTYDLYRANNAGFAGAVKIVSAANTPYTVASPYHDLAASGGTTYYYEVIANAADALSGYSNADSATPGGPNAIGIGDPAGATPNAIFTGATYSLTAAGGTLNRIVLSITLNHQPQASDLKSIQLEGTAIALNSTQGITVNGNTLTFDSAAAGVALPAQYSPLQLNAFYSVTANVATTQNGSTTTPLELTGHYTTATGLSQSFEDSNHNFIFNIQD